MRESFSSHRMPILDDWGPNELRRGGAALRRPKRASEAAPGRPLRWQPRWWLSRGRLVRFALALAGLWVAYQLLSGEESVLVGLSARRERIRLDRETAALKSHSDTVRQVRGRVMKDPEFLEQVAREQQGMCKEGEKVAVVLPPETEDQ
jgi:cell division protein FtsB